MKRFVIFALFAAAPQVFATAYHCGKYDLDVPTGNWDKGVQIFDKDSGGVYDKVSAAGEYTYYTLEKDGIIRGYPKSSLKVHTGLCAKAGDLD